MTNFLTQLPTLLWALLILYTVVAAVFILLENKSPSKTLAWLMAFILLPGLGMVIYLMFGRDYRAFSREHKLLQQELSTNLTTSPQGTVSLTRSDWLICTLVASSVLWLRELSKVLTRLRSAA